MTTANLPTAAPALASPLSAYRELDDRELADRIEAVRQRMGPRLLILGHHYQ
ncbi:quinolinate synthase NadA, partial [bacterium]|nr:quinolinate synthase NadA [bacterium]